MKSYLKLVAVAAVLAMTLIPSLRSSNAKNEPTPTVAGADLTNEERVIGKYFDDLVQYQQESFQVKKRTALRSVDLDPLERKSENLQSRLSEVQNAVREIITKLKAADEWNDLDTSLLARVTDPTRRAFFQESSFKADLEYAASNLSSHKDEIRLPLDALRKRVARGTDGTVTFVMAAYHPPTPMFGIGLACRLGQVRLKLITKNGGNLNGGNACNAVFCSCGKAPPCGSFECPGTGATQ